MEEMSASAPQVLVQITHCRWIGTLPTLIGTDYFVIQTTMIVVTKNGLNWPSRRKADFGGCDVDAQNSPITSYSNDRMFFRVNAQILSLSNKDTLVVLEQ